MPDNPTLRRLRTLISEAAVLKPNAVEPWRERARLAVLAGYGDNSSHLQRFDQISYSLGVWTGSTPDSAFDDAKLGGVRDAVAMLEAFVEDLAESITAESRPGAPGGRQVFVVHGHDEALRERVAGLLKRLSLEPIVVQEQTDRGRTVIEKFEEHALDVGYAVVLITPDDFGRAQADTEWPATPNRARQNVILELGYFMGALGRSRTAAI